MTINTNIIKKIVSLLWDLNVKKYENNVDQLKANDTKVQRLIELHKDL